METFPTVTDLAATPTETGTGHLWILEHVEGILIRFSLRDDGRLVFGDRTRRLDPETIAPAIRPAIEHVRAQFHRDAFRDAVSDVSTVTFYGVATCQHRLDYDWGRLPPFVGDDVYVPARGGLLPPDSTHAIFERLGLTPAPPLEREVRADSFHPERYSFPDSKWAETAVAGVRLADKHGWRGRLDNSDRPAEPTASFPDAETAVEELVAERDLHSLTTGDPVDELCHRLAREHRAELSTAEINPDDDVFRSAVARLVGRR
jgi:hypothetical protein